MSLLVVGSVAFDALETPYGKVDRTLGGAASYFALAASFFTPVRVVAWSAMISRRKTRLSFTGAKIDLAGLEHAPGKTFFWAGRYSQNMNERTTLATELNVFANFNPKLPRPYCDSPYIFLGEYRSHAAALGAESNEVQAESGRPRHHELLDRAHARGIARNSEAHPDADDQRR